MKSNFNGAVNQTIIGEGTQSATVGYIFMFRAANTDYLNFYYADGTATQNALSAAFFAGLNNQ